MPRFPAIAGRPARVSARVGAFGIALLSTPLASLGQQELLRPLPLSSPLAVAIATPPPGHRAVSPGLSDFEPPDFELSEFGLSEFGRAAQSAEAPSAGRATLYSVVLPGAGQHLLGQNRKWAYLALEAAGWFFYVDRRSAGGELKTAYRDFAWNEARLQSGPRVDGDFDYYETLTKWGRSGAFDTDPAMSGVQPEDDPTTFNGSVWSLATSLFLPDGPSTPPSDPQYQRALAYYEGRGYGSEFLWDWSGTGAAQDEYGDLITASDERYRQATNVLGAIIANHVVSAVDAYLSSRGVPTPSEIRVTPGSGPSGRRWHADVRVGVGH